MVSADLGAAERRPLRRAGEDDVVHLLAAHRARRLRAEHPADGVDDVGLAAAVRARRRRDARLEVERRGLGEGLEALERQRSCRNMLRPTVAVAPPRLAHPERRHAPLAANTGRRSARCAPDSRPETRRRQTWQLGSRRWSGRRTSRARSCERQRRHGQALPAVHLVLLLVLARPAVQVDVLLVGRASSRGASSPRAAPRRPPGTAGGSPASTAMSVMRS